MMTYDEKSRCDYNEVVDRLWNLFEQNGMGRHSDGLKNIPIAPGIPQPGIEKEDDPAIETFGRGELESLESTHTIPEMPQYEPRNMVKKPLLDARGFDWNFYISQMRITASMDDSNSDSDEEPYEEEKVNLKDY